MTNFPTMPEIIDQLRLYKKKLTLSNAQVGAAMAAVGWGQTNWSTGHVADLMIGAVQPTEAEIEFIKIFLLRMFYAYNIT